MQKFRGVIWTAVAAAAGMADLLHGAVLYSNLQGNYTAQQTGSYTVNKGTYTNGGPNNGYSSDFDFGSSGVADDYTVDTTASGGAATVQFQAISFFGDIEPTAGNPAGSLGTRTDIEFYDSSKALQTVVSVTLQFQGNGLHTYSLTTPTNIPSSGYIGFSPTLASTFDATTGVSTPKSNGQLFIAGTFGAAPTVGSSDPLNFATINTNRAVVVQPAQTGSLGDLQFALYSTAVATPEPTTIGLACVGFCGCVGRRRRV